MLSVVQTLRELMRDEHFPLHLHHSTIDDFVTVHGAVMTDNKELVNVGDFVATSDLTVSPFPHVIYSF